MKKPYDLFLDNVHDVWLKTFENPLSELVELQAPKTKVPSHGESFNPPPEFV